MSGLPIDGSGQTVFSLAPLLESDLNPNVHDGYWPFARDAFEDGLRSGAVEGEHWPSSLPDNVDRLLATRPRPRRHRLRYRWNRSLPQLGVISCNPSKATRRHLDDTLEVTVNQAALWGFGAIDQGNLDPVYETNSATMDKTADLRDPANQTALEAILQNDYVWLAWGNKPSALTGELNLFWRRAEQSVLRAAYARQAEGAHFLATKLNKPSSGHVAPAHPSPRRFPPKMPPKLFATPVKLRITCSIDV